MAGLRLRAEALGITKLRAGSRGISLDFTTQPRIDSVKLIRLIQSQPKLYKLEGQKRLQQFVALEDPAKRGDAATRLLDTLAA